MEPSTNSPVETYQRLPDDPRVLDRQWIIDRFAAAIPPLSFSQRKGQCGRLGVLGGSFEYTGAPYYSAYSSLRMGADLAFIFCEESAASPIKSYCPDVIVYPVLKKSTGSSIQEEHFAIIEKIVSEFRDNFLQRIHALVIGPGLGRDELVLETTSRIIQLARERQIPLIIDGDGLFLISRRPELIYGFEKAILTPNAIEFQRLCLPGEKLADLCLRLGGTTIVQKGHVDLICDGTASLTCSLEGSPRRCGGQGDILTGLIGTFLIWFLDAENRNELKGFDGVPTDGPSQLSMAKLFAAYAGCMVLKSASASAFHTNKRATLTPHIIGAVGQAFEQMFPCRFER